MRSSSVKRGGRGALLAVASVVSLVARAQPPASLGAWAPAGTFPVSATHTHLLPTGLVMFHGEFEEGLLPPRLWNPATGELSQLPVPDYNIFCTGHSFLADGRLLVTGGHVESHVGLPHTSLFNPFTLTWSRAPGMNDNRWYPTNTTLRGGDVLVLSGETHAAGSVNALPQVWQADTGTWRDLSTAVRDIPYYPRMFLAPNGKLFYAGPQRASRWLDPEGTGTWFDGPRSNNTGRSYGSAVLVGSKVFIIGGGTPPLASVEMLDLAESVPTWRPRASMAFARRQINATLMPDGKVLVTGGSSGSDFDDETLPVKTPELYDPQTDTWTKLAPQAEYRGYHATTLLLPDGRVLSAGGRKRRTAELFTPPSLLLPGPRPTLPEAPPFLEPGSTFSLRTEDAGRVAQVTLLALGSVTHAFDQNQRFLSLPFTREDGVLRVTAPADNLAAPPGYYQLFLVDARGVPSVGRMVRVNAATPRARTVLRLSDVWRYDDRGMDLGTDWLAPGFDDSAWRAGPGQLGYGDGDEGTVLSRGSPTVYFRKKLTLEGPVTAARLEALYDDGLAVWINGVPVFTRNMANGTEFGAWASASVTNAYERFRLPLLTNPFRVGENVVTVMVKQVAASSTDLTFALALEVELADAPLHDTLALTAPTGGEILQPGTSTAITWASSGAVSRVNLELSTNNGLSWTSIASDVANTGLYTWTVPPVRTAQGRVRVSRPGDFPLMDRSRAAFTIQGATPVVAIPFQSTWRYQDSGEDPGPQWSARDFDDRAWPEGPGQLGYGDGDEATRLRRTTPAQPSVYFRKTFLVEGTVLEADLDVLYDDGLAVFLNGTQVFTRNVDKGTAHEKYATASVENALASGPLPPSLFVPGENTLAVVVKQNGAGSPDLSFDLELRLGVALTP